jgi:hypothetical protein
VTTQPTPVDMAAVPVKRSWIADLVLWLARLDWLTIGAFLLTIGSFLGAVLDSYTSLCVIGATQGHIGIVGACPDVGGWDTRTFPLSVDMGWGGALLAVVRLARTIGIGSWRWWVVLGFEALTAAFTVAGNAFHGAVLDGATAGLAGSTLAVVISSVASAVPGVVAVGSGFTLSVLVSTREVGQRGAGGGDGVGITIAGGTPEPPPRARDAVEAELPPEPNRLARVAARAEVRRLLRRHGEALTAERVAERTGVSIRHARKLLRQERGEAEAGRRPRLVDMTAEPATADEEV